MVLFGIFFRIGLHCQDWYVVNIDVVLGGTAAVQQCSIYNRHIYIYIYIIHMGVIP
jgi:hypothetical protein